MINLVNTKQINAFLEKDVLSNGGSVCGKFYDDWATAKSNFLFDYFKDTLIFKKKVSFEKDFEAMRESVKDIHNKIIDSMYSALDWESFSNYKPIISLEALAQNKVIREREVVSIATGKPVKIQVGAKISRILRHLVRPSDLEYLQVEYSKAFNDKIFSGYLCLSIHPLDYITMSVNESGWQSCLNAYDGCYRAGIGSLMNSENTMIGYYITDEKLPVVLTEELQWNDKKWRTIVSVSNGRFVHLNRQYPYKSDILSEALLDFAQEIFFENVEMTNSREKGAHDICIEVEDELMYNDAQYHETMVRIVKALEEDIEGDDLIITSGSTCPVCGEHKTEMSKHLECLDCGDFPICGDCGRPLDIDDDDTIYLDDRGVYICYHCSDDYSWCDHCDRYVPYSEISEYGRWDRICSDCIENDPHIVQCECCNRYDDEDRMVLKPVDVTDEDAGYQYFCPDCVD